MEPAGVRGSETRPGVDDAPGEPDPEPQPDRPDVGDEPVDDRAAGAAAA